ncbi:hypothetical protein Tco_0849004 [Tanacetum coccineum]
MKDEAGGNLNEEENDFMLDNHYGDDSLEELNATIIMMECIQPAENNDDAEPKHDAKTISEVNVSQINPIGRMSSERVHENTNHAKFKIDINTSNDDQIDSSIIFDDSYVENNGREDEHDSNAHDQSVTLESLIQNVQKEAKNQRSLNNELKKQKSALQKELETCKEWVKILEKQPVKSWNYKEAYEELEREYIVDLEDKFSAHDRIVYKMGQSIQTIHMLGEKPNKVYDPFLKAGLGYQNLKRLKKAIKAQPKMYNGERFQSTKLIIDLPDYEETLEDAEEIENVNQKTYAYADVRAKNQDLLMTISELKAKLIAQAKNMNTKFDKSATLEKLDCVTPLNKNKDLKATTVSKKSQSSFTSVANKNDTMNSNVSELKYNEQAKNVNTKFDKSTTLEILVYVTPLNKNKDLKATKVSKVEIRADKSKPVTLRSTSKNKQRVASSSSVSRSESKDTNLLNTKSKSTSTDVKKSQSSFTSVANKNDTMHSNVFESKTNVLKAKIVNAIHDGSNLVMVKRALFTSPVAAKSSKLGATLVTDIQKMDKNEAKMEKTKHRIGRV